MKCQLCNVNSATVHVTELINGQKVELHICEECAMKKAIDLTPQIPFNEIISGLMDFTSKKEQDSINLECSGCGMDYDDFKKHGRLGCEECYESFKAVLVPLIKRVQGATHNMGKMPVSSSGEITVDAEIQELAVKLKQHIAREEFEEAAQVRDKIKMLEAKKNKKTKKSNKDE